MLHFGLVFNFTFHKVAFDFNLVWNSIYYYSLIYYKLHGSARLEMEWNGFVLTVRFQSSYPDSFWSLVFDRIRNRIRFSPAQQACCLQAYWVLYWGCVKLLKPVLMVASTSFYFDLDGRRSLDKDSRSNPIFKQGCRGRSVLIARPFDTDTRRGTLHWGSTITIKQGAQYGWFE